MNTLNITSGKFKFGLSITSTDSLSKIWILHNVPDKVHSWESMKR